MKKTLILAALVLAAVVVMAATGCTLKQGAPMNQMTREAEQFYSAASGNSNDWGRNTQILRQIDGEQTADAEQLTVRALREKAERERWQFTSDYSLNNSFAFFRNGPMVETVALTGSFPAARNGATVYVAFDGRVYQVLSEQPSTITSQMMNDLVARWGSDLSEDITPWLRNNVNLNETMFGHIGTNLWGHNSLWNFLQYGFNDYWSAEIVNEGYASPPWSVNSKWYENGADKGTISQGTMLTDVYFPADLGDRLGKLERILLGFMPDGTVLAPRLHASLSIGQPRPPAPPPTEPPTTPPTTDPTVTSIVLEPNNASRRQGENITYTITTNWTNGKDDWHGTEGTLNHNGGANLSVSGRTITVTSNAPPGNYTIWATHGGKTSNQVTLTVTGHQTYVPATGLTVNPTSRTIQVGETFNITATVTPSNASGIVTWSSSNPNIASVEPNGRVTGKAVGQVTITATIDAGRSSERSATTTVTVQQSSQKTVQSIELTPTTATIQPGGQQNYSVIVRYTDGTTGNNATLRTNGGNNLTVNGMRVTGNAIGRYEVWAEAGGRPSNVVTLTVAAAQRTVTNVALSPATASIQQGGRQDYQVVVTYSDGTTDNNAVIKTNGGNNLTVNGLRVTAAANAPTGNYDVWAEAGNKQSNAILTVTASGGNRTVSSVNINPRTASVLQGGHRDFVVDVYYSDETSDSNATLHHDGGANLSASGNRVTASANATPGTYKVWARAGGVDSPIVVFTVQSASVPITGLRVSPLSTDMYVNDEEQFSVAVTPSNATNRNAVTWRSSNPAIATVSGNGVVKAVGVGTAYIYAEAEGVQHYGTVRVRERTTNIAVTHVALNPASITILIGGHADIYATVTPFNASNINLVWSSSNNSIATVTQDGRVTGVAEGNVTITATTNGVSGTATVRVNRNNTADPPPADTEDPPSGPSTFSGTIIERFDGTTNNTRSQTFVQGQDLVLWVNDYRGQQGKEVVGWTSSTGGSGSLTGQDGGSFTIPASSLSNGVTITINYRAIPGWEESPPPENIDGF